MRHSTPSSRLVRLYSRHMPSMVELSELSALVLSAIGLGLEVVALRTGVGLIGAAVPVPGATPGASNKSRPAPEPSPQSNSWNSGNALKCLNNWPIPMDLLSIKATMRGAEMEIEEDAKQKTELRQWSDTSLS